MIKVNYTGDVPAYMPVEYQRPEGGVVYGLNLFPGEQELSHNAWDALNGHSQGRALIESGVLSLSAPALAAEAVTPSSNGAEGSNPPAPPAGTPAAKDKA